MEKLKKEEMNPEESNCKFQKSILRKFKLTLEFIGMMLGMAYRIERAPDPVSSGIRSEDLTD